MTGPRTIVTDGPAGTERVARELSANLRRGDLVRLIGDLGAGKTTFVRGLAAGLGLVANVQSPTFTLLRVYGGHAGDVGGLASERLLLGHADLYRLASEGEMEGLGFEEILDEGILVVEWADRFRLPAARTLTVRFEHLDPDHRQLTIGPVE